MVNQDDSNKVLGIVKDYKTKSNKDLIFVMDFLQKDFEVTKDSLLKLTHHLDKIENIYNTILKEYENRTKKK
jgi:hypothetical protein